VEAPSFAAAPFSAASIGFIRDAGIGFIRGAGFSFSFHPHSLTLHLRRC